MPDLIITPASNDINSSGGTLVLRTSDAQPLSLKTNNSDALYINSSGSVGIGTTTANTKLKVLGSFSQRAAGTTEIQEYKNVITFSLDDNGTGGYVVKTPFLIGSSYEMAIVHVKGYGYGAAAIYDFKVVFYDYGPSSAPINYSLVDLGNDGTIKYLGKDSSGYVNICFGGLASTNYYFRFTVDCTTTRSNAD